MQIVLLVSCLLLSSSSVIYSKPIKQKFTPKNTVLVFDIDNVLLAPKKRAIISSLWKHKKPLLSALIDVSFVTKIIKTWWRNNTDGAEWKTYIKDHKPELVPLMEELLDNKKIIPESAQLVEELYRRGYTLDIATNMTYDDLKVQHKKYPELFELFENLKALESNDRTINPKPDIAYYLDYLKTHADRKKPNMIFIDNSEENVKSAETLSFYGIIFESAEQLRTELTRLNIL